MIELHIYACFRAQPATMFQEGAEKSLAGCSCQFAAFLRRSEGETIGLKKLVMGRRVGFLLPVKVDGVPRVE